MNSWNTFSHIYLMSISDFHNEQGATEISFDSEIIACFSWLRLH